jgi:hypothetical protein
VEHGRRPTISPDSLTIRAFLGTLRGPCADADLVGGIPADRADAPPLFDRRSI